MAARTALVIDDEAQIRRVVRHALAEDFVRTLEADTGAKGIDLAAAERPALIVLDLGLPDTTGAQVCTEIRKWSDAPILARYAWVTIIRLILNDHIDAAVAAFFLISVVVILVASAHEWFTVLTDRKVARSTEIPSRR